MPRWDPETSVRLQSAALELFAEHGYERVTAAQIAERAGLARRTFFRYFADKREVLFAGAELLPAAAAEALASVDAETAPLPAALDALAVIGELLEPHAAPAGERRAVIDAAPELRERERTKLAAIEAAIADGLRRRGSPADHAQLIARISTAVFDTAWTEWSSAGRRGPFRPRLVDAAGRVRTALEAIPVPRGDLGRRLSS